MIKPITTMKEAENYFFSHLQYSAHRYSGGEYSQQRVKYILERLGNPQDKIPAIHVSGTSGKGSTSYFLSTLLMSQGKRVGLHVSPHLLDIRERFQINGNLIDEKTYFKKLNTIVPIIESVSEIGLGNTTYLETLISFAFYLFAEFQLDYIIIEVGIGGLLDSTNVINRENKISIITDIGYDHTQILGETLEEIAFQKAGIINPNSKVVTINQKEEVLNVFKEESKKKNATLEIIKEGKQYIHKDGSIVDIKYDDFEIENLNIHQKGDYQVRNFNLALRVLSILSKRDGFEINKESLRGSLETLRIKGRFEVFENKHNIVILDDAHNPQKMKGFVGALRKEFPEEKFEFLVAIKNGKNTKKILEIIVPISTKIYITRFFEEQSSFKSQAKEREEIAIILNSLNFKDYEFVFDKDQFIRTQSKKDTNLVITASGYLVSDMYPIVEKYYTVRK